MPGDRLREARIAAGYETAAEAAEAMGVPRSTYIQHESGTRGYPAKRAARYARFFGTTPEWLLYGQGGPRSVSVPLVGRVIHGDLNLGGSCDRVAAPEGATSDTVAAEVGDDSFGAAFQGWLLFWAQPGRARPSPPINALCAVGLPSGAVTFGVLKPASQSGRYHLIAHGSAPPLLDIEVSWASRVIALSPK